MNTEILTELKMDKPFNVFYSTSDIKPILLDVNITLFKDLLWLYWAIKDNAKITSNKF